MNVKISWIWCLLCKILCIFSVMFIYQCNINLIHEDDMFLSIKDFSWARIIVPGCAKGEQLKLNMPNSCSWADIFGLILGLRIRF